MKARKVLAYVMSLLALGAAVWLPLPVLADVTVLTYATTAGLAQPNTFTAANTFSAGLTDTTGVFTTSVTIGGATPTAITNIRVYAPSCTPGASTAAIQTHLVTCAVTGLTTADKVIVNGPAPASLCPLVHARVSAADTLQLHFTVLTAAICTPAAGTYNVVAIRS